MILKQNRVNLFFFNDTATTEIYTLSLHDALPICAGRTEKRCRALRSSRGGVYRARTRPGGRCATPHRSEEHTSELQSQSNLVCRLLLEKKKNEATRWLVLCLVDLALRFVLPDRVP